MRNGFEKRNRMNDMRRCGNWEILILSTDSQLLQSYNVIDKATIHVEIISFTA